MNKLMYGISIVSLLLMFVFFGLFIGIKSDVCLTIGISAMTVAYHFIIRLVIGNIGEVCLSPKNLNPNKRRFQPKRFEKKLYKLLRVKRWKKLFPTYDPDKFSLHVRSIDELIFESCKAEIIHLLCAVAGFASLIFSIWFGSFAVFLITSIVSGLYDMCFVVIQRFNRPRLMKIAAKGKYN